MGTLTVASVHGCQGCGACLLTCPEHAIKPLGRELLVSAERCTGCGECVEVCPVDAIDLIEIEFAVSAEVTASTAGGQL